MISSYKSPLRFLAASLLVSGLVFASSANAINIQIDPEGDKEDQPTETMDVKESDTIASIKQRLETTDAGYPPELQALYFENKKLEDHKTLAEYGIKEGAKLQLKIEP